MEAVLGALYSIAYNNNANKAVLRPHLQFVREMIHSHQSHAEIARRGKMVVDMLN